MGGKSGKSVEIEYTGMRKLTFQVTDPPPRQRHIFFWGGGAMFAFSPFLWKSYFLGERYLDKHILTEYFTPTHLLSFREILAWLREVKK